MYLGQIIVIVSAIAVIALLLKLYRLNREHIQFIAIGSDNGFKFSEINLLWRLAKECDLDEPVSLYISVGALNRAISIYISQARSNGTEDTPKVQGFLSKLYKFRTKINIDHQNKKGLESTKYLDNGQKLRIILPGCGVFKSSIMNNGYELVAKLPTQNGAVKLRGEEWVGRDISVYLWRKGDAHYVFDSRVTDSGVFNGQNVIYLTQSNQLVRAQKRKSVRSECNISANLYFLNPETLDYNEIFDEASGYKCLLEDISEDGALVRIGGQGKVNAQIKLQFKIGDSLIMMFGIVRAVEYNKKFNQSRLHFESIHLEPDMKNKILSFVYNILPPEEKDIFDALSQTEEDEKQDDIQEQNQSQPVAQPVKTEAAEEKTDTQPSEESFDLPKPADISEMTIEELANEEVSE